MKIRWLPVLVTFTVSLLVLFGGWQFYHSMALQNPLTEQIRHLDGVEQVETVIDGKKATVRLRLSRDASLREIVNEIEKSSSLQGRTLHLDILNESSSDLDRWWSTVLFDIAQAMETKQYSDIPDILKERGKAVEGLRAEAEMDEEYVYIRLLRGEASKFILLPRTPAQLTGWSDA